MQTGLEGVDRVELTLANEGLRLLDHPLFRLDTELQVSIGYAPDDVELVFDGIVVGADATFPAESMPTLTVVAHDRRQRLQESSATRWFAIPIPDLRVLPIPDILVAPAVALEHGLIPILDPIGAALSVLVQGASVLAAFGDPDGMQKIIRKQHDQTNLEFLELVARENGWEMLVDHAAEPSGYQLRFMSPLSRLDADVTLRYGASLIDFLPKITRVGQIAGIAVKVWRPEIKLELTVSVGWDWDRQSLQLGISPGLRHAQRAQRHDLHDGQRAGHAGQRAAHDRVQAPAAAQPAADGQRHLRRRPSDQGRRRPAAGGRRRDLRRALPDRRRHAHPRRRRLSHRPSTCARRSGSARSPPRLRAR